jgi:hypothetical protein
MAFAALLDGLQAFTSDRSSNLVAAVCGAGGALAVALLAGLFIRARKRRASQNTDIPQSNALFSASLTRKNNLGSFCQKWKLSGLYSYCAP